MQVESVWQCGKCSKCGKCGKCGSVAVWQVWLGNAMKCKMRGARVPEEGVGWAGGWAYIWVVNVCQDTLRRATRGAWYEQNTKTLKYILGMNSYKWPSQTSRQKNLNKMTLFVPLCPPLLAFAHIYSPLLTFATHISSFQSLFKTSAVVARMCHFPFKAKLCWYRSIGGNMSNTLQCILW